MATSINCFSVNGINGYSVEVEVNTNYGQPGISIIGMGDLAIREASERVKATLTCSGYEFPESRVVINLAPSNIKKYGSHFDLAMAIGLLVQTDQIVNRVIKHYGFIGELSLNGKIRGVSGVLPMVLEAKRIGLEHVIVPMENIREAMLVQGIHVFGFEDFSSVLYFLEGKSDYNMPTIKEMEIFTDAEYEIDFSDVKGQEQVIRNTVVAAAGGHNMLLIGEPGCGKSMIAKRIPTILPKMTEQESLEVTKIHSVTGRLEDFNHLILKRPFRALHHNASANALIGGGKNAMPGEVTLAHNGVLFLDEMVEFNRSTLESLRQPMEDKEVTISRVNSVNTFPANFMLIAAINPCPCGFYGTGKCTCTQVQIKRYRQRISGPVMDRIDIIQKIKPVNCFDVEDKQLSKSSSELRFFVERARNVQTKRFYNIRGVNCNAQMNSSMIKEFCALDSDSIAILKDVFDNHGLSARTYDRLLRIARTYANLENIEKIRKKDIINAISARGLKLKL